MNSQSSTEPSVQRATQLLTSGDYSASEGECRAILARTPNDPQAQLILGIGLQMARRFAESEAVFETLTRLEPTQPAHWSNLGTSRRGVRKFDLALDAFTRAAALGATGPGFDFNVALTHLDRGDLESAYALLKRATEADREDAEIRYHFAQTCFDTLRTDEASAALTNWQTLRGLHAALTAEIAQLLTNLGDPRAADLAVKMVLAEPALPSDAALILVQIFERTNRVAEARKLFDHLLGNASLDLNSSERQLTEAQLLQREGKHDAAQQLLTRALPKADEFPLRHFQLFPLARSLDALKRYDDAWRVMLEAHASQAQYLSMSSAKVALRGKPEMVVTNFSAEAADVAAWDHANAPGVEQSPIFIVAFPRSGTTLLELALDAHPQLKSMDEQRFVQDALDEMQAAGASYPQRLADLTQAQLATIRANYWARVAKKVTLAPGQRLVDKNPLNILRLPGMVRLFPNARFLLAVRHPCDVLLSCYMQHFRAPDFALLCHDLPTLANGFRRTFDYWYAQAALLKPAIHEVRYESFVADFETQMHAITDFLALPWDARVLKPAERAHAKGFISTPSYAQVTEPVNQKSVGRWRAYEEHFAEVLPALAPYIDRWGYAAGGESNSR